MRLYFVLISVLASSLALPSTESPKCLYPKIADIGWTDVSASSAVLYQLLSKLGYNPSIALLSVPITFASLKNGDADIFLGNWMPTMRADIEPYLQEKSIVQLVQNLKGARYTLAVPEYVYEAGLRTFEDIHRFDKQLRSRIFGIEPGNDGNRQILKMIDSNDFSLGRFRLVESSEQGMLVAVKQAIAAKEWVVFLGWAPHPMNRAIKMRFLSGGDRYFGANFGESSVFTVTRNNFSQDCPNIARLLNNLKFSVEQENELMELITVKKLSPLDAASFWLASHPDFMSIPPLKKGAKGDFVRADSQLEKIPPPPFPKGEIYPGFTKIASSYVDHCLSSLCAALAGLPWWLCSLFISIAAWFLHKRWTLVIGVWLSLGLIRYLGFWIETSETFVLVLVASSISMALGVPMGIACAHYPRFYRGLSPILDAMQTLPTFVYLIPTLMLFGLGMVPGLVSTIIFSMPAAIRLTHLGFSQIPIAFLEAADAFGASSWQKLWKVELPHARSSIRLAFSQCITLSLSMVVIAALVGANGLGSPVVRALNTVNMVQGFSSGICIVVLALLFDRLSRSSASPNGDAHV